MTFVAAIDQFDFTESLYQPIVTGPIIGAILGDVQTGLVVGGTYQLMTIGNMPIGGAQPPNAVIGGIMAAVFACTLDMDPNVAVATAIPFALLGQYGVTLFFTLRAPMMESFRAAAVKADTKAITKLTVVSEIILGLALLGQYGVTLFFTLRAPMMESFRAAAVKADTKAITKLTVVSEIILGLIFAAIVTLFFVGGLTAGQAVVEAIPAWLNAGLSAAGGMMKFVGFAILLKIMMSRDMWAFFLLGFGLTTIVHGIPALAKPELLIMAIIGFGIAFWDFQQQTELKGAAFDGGDMSDGI